jgi:uncharacterized protein YegP (UPF0339 family)
MEKVGRKPKIEIYKATGFLGVCKGFEWRWRLKAKNGEIVASGEAYKRKYDAIRAVRRFQKIATDAAIVHLSSPERHGVSICV